MAVPKRRTSRSRRDKRRSHHALAQPARADCPQCGAPRLPHRVCGSCGFYRDKVVVETDDEI